MKTNIPIKDILYIQRRTNKRSACIAIYINHFASRGLSPTDISSMFHISIKQARRILTELFLLGFIADGGHRSFVRQENMNIKGSTTDVIRCSRDFLMRDYKAFFLYVYAMLIDCYASDMYISRKDIIRVFGMSHTDLKSVMKNYFNATQDNINIKNSHFEVGVLEESKGFDVFNVKTKNRYTAKVRLKDELLRRKGEIFLKTNENNIIEVRKDLLEIDSEESFLELGTVFAESSKECNKDIRNPLLTKTFWRIQQAQFQLSSNLKTEKLFSNEYFYIQNILA